jgi:hypothetical protein
LTFFKITSIKECIDGFYHSRSFSQLQALAIIHEIRKLVSCEDLRVNEILKETSLVETCNRLLNFSDTNDVEVYCIKLEVYWIMTNLFMTDDKKCITEIL